MKKHKSLSKILTFYIVILIFTFLIFNFANAAGLVPCGTERDAQGTITNPCTWPKLMQLFKNIIDFIIYNIMFPLSAVMIVVGGIFIMTAGGSTSRVSTGREIITAAVVGLIIALLSWLIIDTIIKIVAVGWNAASLGPWNQL